MSKTERKQAYVVRSFNDIGTGKRFTAGGTPLLDPGTYANYEAAGLVRAPTEEEAARRRRRSPGRRSSQKK